MKFELVLTAMVAPRAIEEWLADARRQVPGAP